jgi:peptidyl-tRNA hydrolase
MKVILGLGNPTKQYANTRHNIGKSFVEYLVKRSRIPVHKENTKFISYVYNNDTLLVVS